jgi:hypothetical protein
MWQHPRGSEEAQTTSNIRDVEALTAWRQQGFDTQNRELRELRSGFECRLRELLPSDATVAATAAIDNHRTAWNESLVKVIGDRDKMAQTKNELRKSLEQSLRRDVPNYDAIRALQQEFSSDYQAVVEANPPSAGGAMAVHPAAWADDLDNFGMKEFEAPFEATELLSVPTDRGIETNLSCTFPGLGLALNDITWHDDNTLGEIYDPDAWGLSDVSVGINFQAPQSGFLNVAVNMQNLFNSANVRGTDNFGFSSATINVYHNAFILLLRGGHRFMTHRHLVSSMWVNLDGDDFSGSFPDFPEGPVVFVAEFEDALRAQEQVQILGGCHTYVRGDVKNMDCWATVKMLWRINKLYVWLT